MIRATVLVALAALVPTIAAAAELAAEREPATIYAGTPASTCEWPSAVAIYNDTTECTASLVHPELLVTAAHCLEGGPMQVAAFGEDSYAPAFEVEILGCTQHPNYQLDYPDYADFMICRLAQPVTGVPIVPILMGCETEGLQSGAETVVVGYGQTDDGDFGLKRVRTIALSYLEDSRAFFRTMATCSGDSGGPTYLRAPDGTWRVFGTTTGGMDCGGLGQSEMIHVFVPWIEDETGLDVTPCHDTDGSWAPSQACGGFPAEPDASHGTWDDRCAGAPVTGASETCPDPDPDTGSPADEGGPGDPPDPDPDGDDGDDDGGEEGSSDGTDGGSDPIPPSTTATAGLGESSPDPEGCACTTAADVPLGAHAALFLLLAAGRRRRRATAGRARRAAS